MKRIFFVLLILLLTGCTSGTVILTGTARTPVNPSIVKIYLQPPSNFEVLGLVESSSEVGFSDQAAMDSCIEELKRQAAKIGANGVILTKTGSTSDGYIVINGGVYSGGDYKNASGQAVWVY